MSELDRRHMGSDHDLLVRIDVLLSTHLNAYQMFTLESTRDREAVRLRVDALEQLRDEAAGAQRANARFVAVIVASSSALTGLVVWLMQHFIK